MQNQEKASTNNMSNKEIKKQYMQNQEKKNIQKQYVKGKKTHCQQGMSPAVA